MSETTTSSSTVTVENDAQTDDKKSKKDNAMSFNTITIIAIALFAIALIIGGYLFIKNRKLKESIQVERTNSQQVLQQKMNLQKEVEHLKSKNKELDKSLGEAFENITAKQILINRLNEENETLRLIKSQLAEMTEIGLDLNTSSDQLKKLQKKINQTIETRQAKNQEFKQKLDK